MCVWGSWYWVAPYTGAWIEIRRSCGVVFAIPVAPYTGAWIEIILQSVLAVER